jgi:hypothetical protein
MISESLVVLVFGMLGIFFVMAVIFLAIIGLAKMSTSFGSSRSIRFWSSKSSDSDGAK